VKLHITIDLSGFAPVVGPLAALARRFALWLFTPRVPDAPVDVVLNHAMRLANLEKPQ
jgi:hypothetical protein